MNVNILRSDCLDLFSMDAVLAHRKDVIMFQVFKHLFSSMVRGRDYFNFLVKMNSKVRQKQIVKDLAVLVEGWFSLNHSRATSFAAFVFSMQLNVLVLAFQIQMTFFHPLIVRQILMVSKVKTRACHPATRQQRKFQHLVWHNARIFEIVIILEINSYS